MLEKGVRRGADAVTPRGRPLRALEAEDFFDSEAVVAAMTDRSGSSPLVPSDVVLGVVVEVMRAGVVSREEVVRRIVAPIVEILAIPDLLSCSRFSSLFTSPLRPPLTFSIGESFSIELGGVKSPRIEDFEVELGEVGVVGREREVSWERLRDLRLRVTISTVEG